VALLATAAPVPAAGAAAAVPPAPRATGTPPRSGDRVRVQYTYESPTDRGVPRIREARIEGTLVRLDSTGIVVQRPDGLTEAPLVRVEQLGIRTGRSARQGGRMGMVLGIMVGSVAGVLIEDADPGDTPHKVLLAIGGGALIGYAAGAIIGSEQYRDVPRAQWLDPVASRVEGTHP
jgi:hypothetical protein